MTATLHWSAAQLRDDFDQAFAEPLPGPPAQRDRFLAVQLAGDPHVIRLAEIANLLPLEALTALPCAVPALMGLTGFRGAILPVYDLRQMLGYTAQDPPRWMVIASGARVALAFDAVDSLLDPPAHALAASAAEEAPRRSHVRGVLRSGATARPIVSLASVLKAVETLAQASAARSL